MSRSYADMITTALRNESQPSPRFPTDRTRLVQAVERGLRMRRRRQQMVRWTMTASAAAAALVLVIGGKTLLNGLPLCPQDVSVLFWRRGRQDHAYWPIVRCRSVHRK